MDNQVSKATTIHLSTINDMGVDINLAKKELKKTQIVLKDMLALYCLTVKGTTAEQDKQTLRKITDTQCRSEIIRDYINSASVHLERLDVLVQSIADIAERSEINE